MASSKRCCVPNCNVTRYNDNTTLHSFPNPVEEADRFRRWMYAISGDILVLDNQLIYKHRKVCHKHFETKYQTWTKRLSPDAIPTLHLSGLLCRKPMSDITREIISNQNILHPQLSQPSTSKDVFVPEEVITTTQAPAKEAPDASTFTLKKPTAITKKAQKTNLLSIIRKLQQKKTNYETRLKKALKLSENATFQKCLKQFTTLAAMFTVMQFREIPKHKMGRRFTKEEKIMALSLYKQGPKAYRWLSKVFVLPSPVTLSRLISRAGIKPGINKNIFSLLKRRTQKMTEDEKLCILLFNEISISPHFDYNRRKDIISGFVTNGRDTKRVIADHALVFMLRGVLKNYKQPIVYTFCSGSTPKTDLKSLLKNITSELQNCGFTVLATVCDQGTTNVSAINSLIQDTKEEYIKNNKTFTHQIFEMNGKEIIPLFDTPHLIKGVRNNLISKNLKFFLDNTTKTAKWDHILKLYEENPAYKGIRLIKNLTELHVQPKKISKMKVKYATQVFSNTVASNIGYLAEKGILPEECKDTADVLLFFDELFDSMNGSYNNSKKRTGKPLLGPVTPKSEHSIVWSRAKRVLSTVKFITKEGRECSVPSICNWIRTLDNIEHMKNKLFDLYNIKSFWMRHFNQDPLENFFGCIRSHGYRNNSPSPAGFEAAYTSLLINNMSSNHSPGSNCEKDSCHIFTSMDCLLSNKPQEIETAAVLDHTYAKTVQGIEIDLEDLNFNFVDFNSKKQDPKINAQINYVTGYILRNAKKNVFKSCARCRQILYDANKSNEYLNNREYRKGRHSLIYPSENFLKLFSEVQDIATNILENKSEMPQIKLYLKTLLYMSIDFSFLDCPAHSKDLIEFIFDMCSRFFIYNWCRDVNKLLNGTMTEFNEKDKVKVLSYNYYKKRNTHRFK